MIKKIIKYSILLTSIGLFSLMGCQKKNPHSSASSTIRIDTLQQLLYQISKCSKLYTSEMDIHKLITYSDKSSLKGKIAGFDLNIPLSTGEKKIIVPIDVKVKTYIDFSKITKQNIVKTDKEIIIILPKPNVIVTASKINHKDVREYVSLFRSNFSEQDIIKLAKQGQDSLIANLDREMLLRVARESADKLLTPLLKRISGDRQVKIDYQDNISPQMLDGRIIIKKLD